ncbi:MAG TPA: hypothetical protein VHE58_02120 [Burkholderiales bacterium]|nr:hypothetical protein [Burkholderiales bacterium]
MNPYGDAPSCWEQKVILVLVQPIRLIGIPLAIVLRPIYMLLAVLRLPLLLVILAMSGVWAILMGIIAVFCKVSLAVPQLRPLSFLFVLPFLLLGDALIAIAPTPSPADVEAKMIKWRFVEKFPYSLQSL